MKLTFKFSFVLCLLLASVSSASSQDFPSVSDVLWMMGGSDQSRALSYINKNGYKYGVTKIEKVKYFSKNCRLKDMYLFPKEKTGYRVVGCQFTGGVSSVIEIEFYNRAFSGVEVWVFNKKYAMMWKQQLKALGYKSNDQGGSGAQGQDWGYSKAGFPDVSIWNDYGNIYTISISNMNSY
jgi:hypothetical protein